MTNIKQVSGLHTAPHRPRFIDARWLLASFAFSFLVAASISYASQGVRSEPKASVGRTLAAQGPTHATVRAGKQVAPVAKFAPEGVRQGKPGVVTSQAGR